MMAEVNNKTIVNDANIQIDQNIDAETAKVVTHDETSFETHYTASESTTTSTLAECAPFNTIIPTNDHQREIQTEQMYDDNNEKEMKREQEKQKENNKYDLIQSHTLESIQLSDHTSNNVYPTETMVAAVVTTIPGVCAITTTTTKTIQAHSPDVATTSAVVGTAGVHSSVENERSNGTDGCSSAAKYTSLVMITQDLRMPAQVNVVTSDTTFVSNDDENSVIVRHTNRLSDDLRDYESNSLAGYFTRSLEEDSISSPNSATKRRPIVTNHSAIVSNDNLNNNDFYSDLNHRYMQNKTSDSVTNDDVTVVTGANTLSAVVCLEDGLADDDSWVEEISPDEEEFATTTATDSDVESAEELTLCSAIDREEELRGYNRTSIDFTLHTIVEESCEESEVETNDKRTNRVSASELEKYFFFGLGDGRPSVSNDTQEDTMSESSSLCSEGLDSIGGPEEINSDSNNLASSRLEKYFLSGFMGFSNERNKDSDGSGSVGSDSEGHASPEQRRKRLVRARGTPRSHNSSLDNLLAAKDDGHEAGLSIDNQNNNDSIDSSETDTCDETVIHLEKVDNQNDTLKRKKQSKKKSSDTEENRKSIGASDEDAANCKTPQPDFLAYSINNSAQSKKQSRDSGFIGSNDDLLKNDDSSKSPEMKSELEEIKEEVKEASPQRLNLPPSSTLTRKDSFNNWSSDEETNLMMSKMRQFFKTLVSSNTNAQRVNNSKSSTPIVSESNTPKTGTPIPKPRAKSKPPQLVYFENELTRLMKTVPGINDDQVREIVEYLSSEDTWSDSYDSSDYTSSDLEGAATSTNKSELQEQISASCQQIIKNFEGSIGDKEGDIGDGGLFEESQGLNRETALVYQKLVASFSKMTTDECQQKESTPSPPIFAKVMSHIGTRLVALMHEVSSGESHTSQSPKPSVRYHRKLHQKISATTTDEDDSASESNLEKNEGLGYINLPRSKSHDLLLSGTRPQHHQSSSGVSDTAAEEKEASDYERFSWRGSFESALLANGDSRTKLTLLDRDNSSSASALAAKRRSAGDLLFNQKSLSREQLDRVRSCGSIGGNSNETDNIESSKLWSSETSQRTGSRRSSIPCDSDNETSEDDHHFGARSTLPRSLQTTTSASTNSLPRLSSLTTTTTAQMQKSQSVYQFLPNSVKSARYRPPGFNRIQAVPKKAVSSLGLQSLYTKRDTRRRIQTIYNGEFHIFSSSLIFKTI